eukprot:CAMPEP_0176499078 /NCGR_PEP_ID=MMETSP0200_2-20121128/12711_1 /TAXON_ID=947934 /ORGANISM="Chaetoceros sp., Strain GSL56" /LENGTH=437 /DNA_ID=CAMNT_0017897425 /DNA_START=311 /DNA_END=1624 /DNA_ORIENTATION=+
MRPKPSREWVINELERLNVRVVTGRCPRDDEYEDTHGLPKSLTIGINDNTSSQFLGYNHPLGNIVDPNFVGRRGSITASLLNAADIARAVNGHGGGPSTWPSGQGQSFNGFGFDPSSMMQQPRKSSLSGSSNMSCTANDFNTTKEQHGGPSNSSTATVGAPPHRPLVGGGSAAAYEAARAEHYRQLAASNKDKGNDSNAREQNNGPTPSSTSAIAPAQNILPHSMENVSNFSTSNSMIESQATIGGLSMVANQHYEMLKLHHMNLLNEIQETTLMMNIYQQQLQQHQQLEMHQQQQEQQIQLEEHQNSYNNSIKKEMMHSHQQPTNNNGENHPTNALTENIPQSKEDDGTEIAGCENNNLDKSMQIQTEKCADDNNGEAGTAGHEIVNNNDKISREDKLARIKAEIEERKRMLEELSKAGDDEQDEVHVKKSKKSPV